MRSRYYINGFVSLSLLTGCSTINVTPRSKITEDAMVPDSEYYEVSNVNIVSQADGLNEKFMVKADSVYRYYSVSQTEEKWDEVIRERYYAVAGIHDNYHIGWDLILEPVLTVVFIAGLPLFYGATCLAAVLGEPVTKDHIDWVFGMTKATVLSASVALVPGIMCTIFRDDFDSESESVEKNRVIVSLGSKQHKEKVTDKTSAKINVIVKNGEGTVLKNSSLALGGGFSLGLETLLSNNANSNLIFQVFTQEPIRMAGGRTEFSFSYKPECLVQRMLAANSNPASYAPVGLTVSAPQIDDSDGGNGNGKLEAGEQGKIVLTISNSGPGDAYRVSVKPASLGGEVQLSTSDELILLHSGKASLVQVPFSIPLKAPSGESVIQFIAQDALGRQSPPFSVRLPYTHRELPELLISSVNLARSPNERDVYTLEVNVRNRGQGAAEKVKISVDGLPNGATLLDKEVLVNEIAALSRQTVPVRIRISEAAAGKIAKLKFSAAERLAVGDTTREVELLFPN